MISQSTMNLPCCSMMFLISLWIQVDFVPSIRCMDGSTNHLSQEDPLEDQGDYNTADSFTGNLFYIDILLLKDVQDPKCFTRTGMDFTCFFETPDNRTYDLVYTFDGLSGPPQKIRCVQRPDEGTFLHICTFPPRVVLLYVEMYLEVVECNTNTSLYNLTLHVEENFLLDHPTNVSLHEKDQAGQLLVSCQTNVPVYCGTAKKKIRYTTKGDKTIETTSDILDSLVPGKEIEIQVTVRCGYNPDSGHWSSWSQPVRAMVPQSADDVSLICYTSDLQSIICQWNGSRYGVKKQYILSHKIGLSQEWTECLTDGRFADLCQFHGDNSRKVRVKLSSTPAPLSRTFYTQEFTLHKILKTSPPSHLRGTIEKDKLCLKWKAPLPSLSAQLQYEVGYQTREGEAWMLISIKGPETGACLEVSTGNQYNIKVRAKPNGFIYSGHWSDWSDVLTGKNRTDLGMLFMLCLPIMMLIPAILIYTYLSKLKQYFWPPVPNLDKVLQGFLTEINRQKWDPPLTAKQCSEETTASVVEIMSEDEVSGPSSPTQLLPQEETLSSGEEVDGSPEMKVFPDYVTLNKDSVILCPKGHKYMYEKAGEKGVQGVGDDLLQTCLCSCTDGSVCVPHCFGKNFLNNSYMPLSEATDKFDYRVTAARGSGNVYTNLPCS